MIDARRRIPGAAHDVISLTVHARDDEGRALSDRELIGHINILLIAGHETTTSLAARALYKLATRPEWVARLQAELAGLGVDRDHPLTIDSLRRVPLLRGLHQGDRPPALAGDQRAAWYRQRLRLQRGGGAGRRRALTRNPEPAPSRSGAVGEFWAVGALREQEFAPCACSTPSSSSPPPSPWPGATSRR